MKKLEKKIIEKTYAYETRHTLGSLLIKILLIIISAISAVILAQAIMIQYQTQQTLDLLQIFSEDFEVVKKYLGEVIQTFYEETPKRLLLLFTIFLVIGIFLILTLVKNFGKIRNRIRSIIRYKHKKS